MLTMPAASYACLKNLDCLVINALRQEQHPTHQTVREALAQISCIQPEEAFFDSCESSDRTACRGGKRTAAACASDIRRHGYLALRNRFRIGGYRGMRALSDSLQSPFRPHDSHFGLRAVQT